MTQMLIYDYAGKPHHFLVNSKNTIILANSSVSKVPVWFSGPSGQFGREHYPCHLRTYFWYSKINKYTNIFRASFESRGVHLEWVHRL